MNGPNPKKLLAETLGRQYKIESVRGSDIIALNSKAILYIRYNKNAGATKELIGKFWFGITKSEYEKYYKHNFFIVCACVFGPDEIDYLVFPSDEFEELKKYMILQSGQWKFNLLKTNEKRYLLQISKKGKYDVTEFLNYFDFSPSEFRRIYAPKIGEFRPKELKVEQPAEQKIPLPLEEELLVSSKDSSNPKSFEIALEKFFNELGFKCQRIGGSGETDILVAAPVRFIVDGKSTKADTKSAINFTRIKRHMNQNQAVFMVIASVGFDPAVARDAELEGATLVDINMLVTLLKIQKSFVLSPFDYIDLFKQPGLITEENLEDINGKTKYQQELIRKTLLIIDNLDFVFRNGDELKGRIDLYCDQKGLVKPEKAQIIDILTLLSNELLGIVSKQKDKYALRFTPPKTIEKIRSTLGMLGHMPIEI